MLQPLSFWGLDERIVAQRAAKAWARLRIRANEVYCPQTNTINEKDTISGCNGLSGVEFVMLGEIRVVRAFR